MSDQANLETAPANTGLDAPRSNTPFSLTAAALIASLVRRNIVPSLAARHGIEEDRTQVTDHAVRLTDIARFVRLLRRSDSDPVPALVDLLISRGGSNTDLYLDWLAPAARLVGEEWLDDSCSFAEVTMVTVRLHQVLHAIRRATGKVSLGFNAPSILLARTPGEQHGFGLVIVQALLADAGWRTHLVHQDGIDAILDAARLEQYDLVGLSIGDAQLAGAAANAISRLRAIAEDHTVFILGGQAVDADPALVKRVGADAALTGGRNLPAAARKLVARQLLHAEAAL